MSSTIERFSADDSMDTLRLEMSAVSPAEAKANEETVKRATNYIEEHYGDYINKEAIKHVKGLENRVVVTTPDLLKEFDTAWLQREEPDSFFSVMQVEGKIYGEGNLIVIANIESYWDTLSENIKNEYVKNYGSIENAKKFILNANINKLLTHESVHVFQDSTLNDFVLESGVRYYQREICEDLQIPYLFSHQDHYFADLYGDLVEKYGDDAHKVFFGSDVRADVKDSLLKEFGKR